MTKVDLATAQQQLPELIAQALAGEEVVIFLEGLGNVRLTPLAPSTGAYREPGWAAGKIHLRDDFDDPLPEFDESEI